VNLKRFFDEIRPIFNGPMRPWQAFRVEIIVEMLEERQVPVRHAAYILATAFHESDRFQAMVEYADGRAYEFRKSLGNTHKGDGPRYKGRGFVQITGRRNYRDWSKRLGLDLIKEPHLASDDIIAARILIDGMLLGTFTGKKLDDYSTYKEMRRVVNGTDRANLIAGYAVDFEDALRKAHYGLPEAKTVPPVSLPPAAPPTTQEPAAPERRSIWDTLFNLIIKLFGGKT
jgi:hypothetical protein